MNADHSCDETKGSSTLSSSAGRSGAIAWSAEPDRSANSESPHPAFLNPLSGIPERHRPTTTATLLQMAGPRGRRTGRYRDPPCTTPGKSFALAGRRRLAARARSPRRKGNRDCRETLRRDRDPRSPCRPARSPGPRRSSVPRGRRGVARGAGRNRLPSIRPWNARKGRNAAGGAHRRGRRTGKDAPTAREVRDRPSRRVRAGRWQAQCDRAPGTGRRGARTPGCRTHRERAARDCCGGERLPGPGMPHSAPVGLESR